MATATMFLAILPSEPVAANRTEIPLHIDASANVLDVINNDLTASHRRH
jgi:hypothetical protein